MKREKIIIATIKSWNILNAIKFKNECKNKFDIFVFKDNKEFNYEKIKKINPQYIFVLHWSWIIPESIYKNFNCVVFHMTDLPFGRGGSPLQNLIIRGISKTKISAIKVVKELDAGPIYLKRNLNLNGSTEGIFKRSSNIIFKNMIPYIINKQPKPVIQKGKVVVFKRRKPEDSRIPDDIDLNRVYDYIRMLDAEGYPNAFIETQQLRFELKNATKKNNFIEASVHIEKKETYE